MSRAIGFAISFTCGGVLTALAIVNLMGDRPTLALLCAVTAGAAAMLALLWISSR